MKLTPLGDTEAAVCVDGVCEIPQALLQAAATEEAADRS